MSRLFQRRAHLLKTEWIKKNELGKNIVNRKEVKNCNCLRVTVWVQFACSPTDLDVNIFGVMEYIFVQISPRKRSNTSNVETFVWVQVGRSPTDLDVNTFGDMEYIFVQISPRKRTKTSNVETVCAQVQKYTTKVMQKKSWHEIDERQVR